MICLGLFHVHFQCGYGGAGCVGACRSLLLYAMGVVQRQLHAVSWLYMVQHVLACTWGEVLRSPGDPCVQDAVADVGCVTEVVSWKL